MTEKEQAIRTKYPKLFMDQEHLEGSEFSSAPQLFHFTTHRMIHTIEPSSSGINRRVTHSSIPYTSLQAFSCRISTLADSEVTLHLYTAGATHTEHKPKATDPDTQTHSTRITLKSNSSSQESTCFRLISFLFAKMSTKSAEKTATATSSVGELITWIQNSDASESSKTVNHPLLSLCPIFAGDEVLYSVSVNHTEDAENASSVCICTNQRLVILTVTSVTKKGGLASFKMRSSNTTESVVLEIQVLPWSCIGGWSMPSLTNETLQWHTSLIDWPRLTLAQAVGKMPSFLMMARCGTSEATATVVSNASSWPHWITDESLFLGEAQTEPDLSEVDRYYHTTVPILQSGETLDLLLHGRRHLIFFTPHRIVVLDIQRSQGKVTNVGYRSLLWTSVIVYGVKMAGQHMDQSTCDLLIYTPMMFDPAAQAGSQPGMSLWELDCHLGSTGSSTLVTIQQYIAARVGHLNDRPPAKLSGIKHDDYSTHLQQLFSQWKGMPNHGTVAQECQKALTTAMPILLHDESVVHCHLIGHGDMAVFTSQRIVEVDTQGWSDQRIVFRSVPYANIHGFCFTADTAEPELQIYTGNLWSLQKLRISYCADDSIMAIAKFLSHTILLKEDPSVGSGSPLLSVLETFRKEIQMPPASPGEPLATVTRSLNVKGLLTSVTDNSLEIKDVSEMSQTLRTDTPLFLENERIERLFQCGRDFFIYTNYRLLYWDVQGIGVTMYTSWPWKYCAGFSIVTANAALDRDAELYLYFKIPGRQRKKQSILVSSCDIYNMQLYVCEKLFSRPD